MLALVQHSELVGFPAYLGKCDTLIHLDHCTLQC